MVAVSQNQEFQNDSLRYENLQNRRKMKNHFYDSLCMIQILCAKALNMQVKKMFNYINKVLYSKISNEWFCGDCEISCFFHQNLASK